jgi:hypothetical protein
MSTTMPKGQPFDLSPERIGELVALANAAGDAADGWHSISSALKNNGEASDIEAVAVAFDYMMREPGEGTGGGAFTAAWTTETAAYPAPPETLSADVHALWAKVAAAATAAPVRSRLHDLLFTIGRQPRHEHAAMACTAYLELGQGSWHPLYRAVSLIRALDIGRKMNHNDLAQSVIAQMIAQTREAIDNSDRQPGVSLRLLRCMIGEKNPPEGIDDLLSAARARYAGDPYIEVEVARLQRGRAKGDNDVLERIDREIVTIWLQAAEASSGLLKSRHLVTAAEYARDHGLNDLLATATTAMQAMTIDDLEMQSFSAPFELSDEQIDQWVGQFTAGGDWRSCVARMSMGENGMPPSGSTEMNRVCVAEIKKDAVLYSMLPGVLIGGDGLPRWQPQTDEDQEQQRLCDVETSRMQMTAPLYATALQEIGRLHNPSLEEVEEFFADRPLLPAGTPRVLADALLRYWSKDYEGCIYILAPKIETILRHIARTLDEPVYRLQRNHTPGKYVGVAVLLQTLSKHGLDESWNRYLNTLLCSPIGWNLRNELAHGFIDVVSGPMAALVVQAALYLAALEPQISDVSASDAAADMPPSQS